MNLMFIGPPLSDSRLFDPIFWDPKSFGTLHHLYVCYHEQFFGDKNIYLTLGNAHISRIMNLLQRKYSKDIFKVKAFDDAILQNQSTKTFLRKVDATFESGLTTITLDFHNHSETVVSAEQPTELIDL